MRSLPVLTLALLVACSSGTSIVRPATVAPASAALPAGAALPLFDAHIHYSEPAWSLLTPDEALAKLTRSGVRRAIVSSSPDTGTQRLYERAPDIVVPFLRPYRNEVGPATWARDGTTVAYMQATYRRGVHRGIGEIHLSPGEVDLPVVRAVLDLAVNERLWLLVHTDARGIDEVMAYVRGRTRVLWAHAGQFASPDEIRRLIERHATLWVELAGRTDIVAGGAIDPAWRALFVAHADRFLVGSDTWINPQWERLEDIHAGTQSWLAMLPADVARRIASGNADELFPPAPY